MLFSVSSVLLFSPSIVLCCTGFILKGLGGKIYRRKAEVIINLTFMQMCKETISETSSSLGEEKGRMDEKKEDTAGGRVLLFFLMDEMGKSSFFFFGQTKAFLA